MTSNFNLDVENRHSTAHQHSVRVDIATHDVALVIGSLVTRINRVETAG